MGYTRAGGTKKMNHCFRYIFAVVLMAVIASALVVRLSELYDIPGLEHDEALICLGAKEIAGNRHFPVTGDKVYEGPLLEYVIAFPIRLTGKPVHSARFVMAFAGILAVLAMYWAGKSVHNQKTGIFAALLMLLSPWHLAASRVIYACNLTQLFIPLWMAATARFLQTKKTGYIVLSGLAVGLAANGRFTAYILALLTLPMLLTGAGHKKIFTSMVFLIAALIPGFPVLLYNSFHSWPAVYILTGDGQSHLAADFFAIVSRITGYSVTLLKVMSGKDFWLDIQFVPIVPVVLLPLFLVTGIIVSLIKYSSTILKWMTAIFLVTMIVIPVFIKSLPGATSRFHPHYLDISMPFAVLLSAVMLSYIEKRKIGMGIVLCFFIIAWQSAILFGQLLPTFKNRGVPGRWSGEAKVQAECITKNFNSDNATVIVPWHFGYGYPQMKIFLPEYSIVPVIHPFYGLKPKDNSPITADIIYVSPIQPLSTPPWEKLVCDFDQSAAIYHVKSPGFLIEGLFSGSTGGSYKISTLTNRDEDGKWPVLNVRKADESWVISISDRTDHLRMHPAMLNLDAHVSPRHADVLESFKMFVVAHSISGSDLEGNLWTFTFPATGAQNAEQPLKLEKNDNVIEGVWTGHNVFY
jgi:4-amino-4-deoxy-L-arabinose transferase-like glycosyltransferase